MLKFYEKLKNYNIETDVTVFHWINVSLQVERIRLANGDAPNVGRVEVLVDGEWGTVCDDLWDIRDANVTCRMLGYPGAIAERAASYFGEGTDFPIWLDNVLCRGTELSLQDCPKNEIGIHNCGHHEDAGVECELPGELQPNEGILFCR